MTPIKLRDNFYKVCSDYTMQTLNFLPDIVDLSGHTNRIIEDIKKDLAGEYNIPADDIELRNITDIMRRLSYDMDV